MKNLKKFFAILLLAFLVFCNATPDSTPSALVCSDESDINSDYNREISIC